jgi:hypothetical protein
LFSLLLLHGPQFLALTRIALAARMKRKMNVLRGHPPQLVEESIGGRDSPPVGAVAAGVCHRVLIIGVRDEVTERGPSIEFDAFDALAPSDTYAVFDEREVTVSAATADHGVGFAPK